jgi:hypothetical protein
MPLVDCKDTMGIFSHICFDVSIEFRPVCCIGGGLSKAQEDSDAGPLGSSTMHHAEIFGQGLFGSVCFLNPEP